MIPWLPALLQLESYSGNWDRYLDAVYNFFRDDFVSRKAFFRSLHVAVGRQRVSLGKEDTFWHLISEGKGEESRTPDLDRCARIRWPRAIVDNERDPVIKIWGTSRNNELRILLFIEEENYLVVLVDRKTHFLLLTAYIVTKAHQRSKLLREYQDYIKKQESPP